MRSRRAQIAGQVFVYIIALIIVAAILLFGYRSITQFRDRADEVGSLQLRQELEGSILSLSTQFGTLKKRDFRLGTDYREMCFLNNVNFNTEQDVAAELADYPLILDTLDSGMRPTTNVFFILRTNGVEPYTIGKTALQGNFRCFPVNQSVVTLRIEGRGDHVLIS